MITQDNLRDVLTSLGFRQSKTIQDEMNLHYINLVLTRDWYLSYTNYNIQARYPEDKDELYNTLTPQACQEMIDETKQMTQWIKDKL